MCPKCTPKPHRFHVRMTDQQVNLIELIREQRPEYQNKTAVIIAALYNLAKSEGVPVS